MSTVRAFLSALAVFLTVASGVSSANAAELVMFEADGCSWCERWHAEIGVVYPNTPEGSTLPLRVVDVGRDRPDDLKHVRGVFFTPTFVIMEGERELGRIRGYPGEDFFWPMLDEFIQQYRLVPPVKEEAAVNAPAVEGCGASLC